MPIINTVIAGGGTTPTGTKNITTNGTHDVAAYEYADVQVPTTAPALYREFALDNNGVLIPSTTTTAIMDFTGVQTIGGYLLYYMYKNNTAISGSVDMSDVTTVMDYGCEHMFDGCTGLTSIDLSSLRTLNMNACSNMFSGCASLTTVDISSLTNIGYSQCLQGAFSGCLLLTTLSFPSVTPNSFGSSNKNQFVAMCNGIPNITLHFPSNTQATVETLTGYSTTAPFGATAGTVLFDLPATYTLTGADTVTYTRNPKYDTATALAWKVGAYGTTNFTPAYYTSGTTDPVVGDTIYSDAACTTAVTTISAIA